jgi:hypothetical protein
MSSKRVTGDLRSRLETLFPDFVAKKEADRRAREEQTRRLAEIAKQLARDRVAPTKATGTPGRNAAGQALQIDRMSDGRLAPRRLDDRGKDWSVRIAADAVEPSAPNHWKAPPPAESPLPPTVADLAGERFGRLSVVRYHRSKKAKGAQWLVRCVCGDYELRSTRALRTAAEDPACHDCEKVDYLRQLSRTSVQRDRVGAAAKQLDELAAKARNGVKLTPLDG